jgi:hypothetical protein
MDNNRHDKAIILAQCYRLILSKDKEGQTKCPNEKPDNTNRKALPTGHAVSKAEIEVNPTTVNGGSTHG